MTENSDNKHKRTGLYISIGIHGLLVLLFLFLVAWREPNPPLPEYGIELNFGLDAAGTGQEQPQQPSTQTPEEQTSEDQQEQPNEAADQPEEVTEPEDSPEPPSRVENTPTPVEKPVTTTPAPSPDVRENKPAEKKTEAPVEKKESKPKPTNTTTKPDDAKKPVATTGKQDNSQPTSSQGDKTNATGDQGDPEGSVDAKSLYGSQGGGDGPQLNMAGWNWDEIPEMNDGTSESGRLVFEISIDEDGYIRTITTKIKTVSPGVEQYYRNKLYNLTFSRTPGNTNYMAGASGTITIVLKAR